MNSKNFLGGFLSNIIENLLVLLVNNFLCCIYIQNTGLLEKSNFLSKITSFRSSHSTLSSNIESVQYIKRQYLVENIIIILQIELNM